MDKNINSRCLEYFKNRKEDSLPDLIMTNPININKSITNPVANPLAIPIRQVVRTNIPKTLVTVPKEIHHANVLAKNATKVARIMAARNAAKSLVSYNSPVRKIQTNSLNRISNSASSISANKALQRRERLLNTIQYDRTDIKVRQDDEEEYLMDD
jgi:hypothetical protein